MKKRFMKRGLSLLLAVVMVLGMIQLPVMTQEVQAEATELSTANMTVTASGTSEGDIGNIFDEETSDIPTLAGTNDAGNSYWTSQAADSTVSDGSTWLQVDMGQTYVISQVDYTPRWYTGTNNYWRCTGNITYLVIEVSMNGSEWTAVTPSAGENLSSLINETDIDTAEDTFPYAVTFDAVEARYIRISAKESYHHQAANVNKYITVADLAIYGTNPDPIGRDHLSIKEVSGTYELTDKTGTNPTVTEDEIEAKIFDDDNTSFWNSNHLSDSTVAVGNPYLTVELDGLYKVNQIDYAPRWHSSSEYWYCTGNIQKLVVEVSVDGSEWTEVTPSGGYDISSKIVKESTAGDNFPVTVAFDEVMAKYVRFSATQSYHWSSGSENTSITIGDLDIYGSTIPEVTVNLKVGETYSMVGEIIEQDDAQNAVAVDSNAMVAPYTIATTITSGERYLIGRTYTSDPVHNCVVTNSVRGSGLLRINDADFAAGDYSDYAWTITAVENATDTYTIYNSAINKYLTFSGTSVVLSDSSQDVIITQFDGENYYRFTNDNTNYLHDIDWGSTSDGTAAAYASYDGAASRWNFYTGSESVLVKAENVGTTTMTIGETVYHINVYDERNITLEVGETYLVVGAVTEAAAPEGVISVQEGKVNVQVTSVASGNYVIAKTDKGFVMTDEEVEIADESVVGMGVHEVENFGEEDLSEYLWTFTAVDDGGYTIQNAEGQYLNIEDTTDSGADVTLSSDTAQVFNITAESNGVFYISNATGTTHYLNNYGGDGDNIAAYVTSDEGSKLYLYQIVDGAVFTGTTPGTTVIKVDGVTYNVTVVRKVDAALLEQQKALASVLVSDDSYTAESIAALQTVLTEAQSVTYDADGYTSDAEAEAKQNEIDDITERLTDAIKALQKRMKSIAMSVGEKAEYVVSGTLDGYDDAEKEIADVTVDGTTMTVEGVSVGFVKLTVGDTTYNIVISPVADGFPIKAGTGQGSGKTITKLTISADNSFDLNCDETVTWSTPEILDADGNQIVTVDENGTISFLTASVTTNITTTVTATTADGVEYTIPMIVHAAPSEDAVDARTETEDAAVEETWDIFIEEISNLDVYYSWDCSTDLIHACIGETIYVSRVATENAALDFMGAPKDGYALTYMASTNSSGHYMTTHTGDDVTLDTSERGFLNYPGGAGVNQSDMFGEGAVEAMLYAAITRGCDGVMGFTRKTIQDGHCTSSLTFRAEQLPTVEKVPYGILPADGKRAGFRLYEDGMTAAEGEFVYFEITVKTYKPLTLTDDNKSTIEYTNAILTDTALSEQDENGQWHGASFIYDYGSDVIIAIDDIVPDPADVTKDITADISKDVWNETETYKEHKYYVAYEITADDLDAELENTVGLTYHYHAEYSTGEYDEAAQADASISVSSFVAKDLVVDFGLPVTVEYPTWGKIAVGTVDAAGNGLYNSVMLTEGEIVGAAAYGTVEVAKRYNTEGDVHNGWLITYTPTQTLKDVDTVTLTAVNTEETFSFKVYPASSVYYEETFMVPEVQSEWTAGGTVVAESQEAAQLGYTQSSTEPKANYGYDAAYADATNSEVYTMTTTDGKEKARFTFTGTGVDVFANCDEDTGIVMVLIKQLVTDADGNTTGTLKKMMTVDTSLSLGSIDTNAGLGSLGETLNVPIVSIPADGLDYGTYEVLLVHTPKKVTTETTVDGVTTESVTAVETKLRIDGFRVYGTLPAADAAVIHAKDNEAGPIYLDIKDSVMAGMSVGAMNSGVYAEQLAANAMSQIYASSGAKLTGAALVAPVTDSEAGTTTDTMTVYTGDELKDFLDNTSKNELYLYPGQSLVFALDAGTNNPQIALKALNGDADYTITSVESTNSAATAATESATMKANTEMYYPLVLVKDADDNLAATTFTITNSSTDKAVLSVTKLKVISGGAAVTFAEIKEEDLVQALLSVVYDNSGEEAASQGVSRISGSTRYETAYAAADAYKAKLGVETFNAVIVATGTNFADALSGSYLASVKNAPILLTNEKRTEELTAYVKANLAADGIVYILGGENAVPKALQDKLEKAGYEVVRLAGADRYQTNLAILGEAGVTGNEILIATGKSAADSLSASATKKPILLVKDEITDAQRAVLRKYDGGKIYIIGGENAVSEEIQTALTGHGRIYRISGATRYETSVKVAETFFEEVEEAIVASGREKNHPDGLCGGPLAAVMNAPLILTADGKTDAAAEYVQAEGIESGIVLGGTSAISDESAREIFGLADDAQIVVK